MLVRTHGLASNQLKNYSRKQDILRQIIKLKSYVGDAFKVLFSSRGKRKYPLLCVAGRYSCSWKQKLKNISGFRFFFGFFCTQRVFFPSDNKFLCQFPPSRVYNSQGYHAFKCCAGYMDNYCCCYLDLNIDKALAVLKYPPFLLLISPHRPLWKCNFLHRSPELDNVISEIVPCLKNHVNTTIQPAFSIHPGFRKFASWKTGKDRSRNGLKKPKHFIRKICQYFPESALKSQ